MARIDLSPEEYAEALDIARRVARPRLGGRADAELDDVAQEAITRLLTMDPAPDDWRAWLNTVAGRAAVDVQRRAARAVVTDDPAGLEDRPLRHFVAHELSTSQAAILDEALRYLTATLSERDRGLLLASSRGATNAELAEEFGLATPQVVAQTLTRIRQRLRAHLAEQGYERHHPRPY